MNVAAGKLRNRITIRKQVESRDQYGSSTKSWQDLDDVWANFHPVSVKEFIASQQTQSQVEARVTIRYRNDVDATCRIQYRGETYVIHGVLPDPESGRAYLTMPVSRLSA